jgi:two-component system, cell cycle sensor histidine kinase and response regulator CckA
MRTGIERNGLIVVAIGAALIYWHYSPVVTSRIWPRILVVGLIFLICGVIQYRINARRDAEKAARKDYEKLEQRIRQRLKQLEPDQGEIKEVVQEHKPAEDEAKRYAGQTFHNQKVDAPETPIGCTAHDFNNLLHAISGYTQLLLMKKDPGDPDYSKIEAIQRSAQRAGELTRQLLIFGRKGGRRSGRADLNHEVIEACKILERTLPETIRIELELASDLQAINVDPTQIEQVILNLGINARRAMPDGGKLIFRTENLPTDNERVAFPKDASPGPYVLLTASDTSAGMEEATPQQIFEPSYAAGEAGEGDGIELSIVYDIVSSHGGYMQSGSEPGGGATFKIFFPASQKENVERMGTNVNGATTSCE